MSSGANPGVSNDPSEGLPPFDGVLNPTLLRLRHEVAELKEEVGTLRAIVSSESYGKKFANLMERNRMLHNILKNQHQADRIIRFDQMAQASMEPASLFKTEMLQWANENANLIRKLEQANRTVQQVEIAFTSEQRAKVLTQKDLATATRKIQKQVSELAAAKASLESLDAELTRKDDIFNRLLGKAKHQEEVVNNQQQHNQSLTAQNDALRQVVRTEQHRAQGLAAENAALLRERLALQLQLRNLQLHSHSRL